MFPSVYSLQLFFQVKYMSLSNYIMCMFFLFFFYSRLEIALTDLVVTLPCNTNVMLIENTFSMISVYFKKGILLFI